MRFFAERSARWSKHVAPRLLDEEDDSEALA